MSEYNNNCLLCAEVNGYYCGDDSTIGLNIHLMDAFLIIILIDGWEDCVDASDEGPDVLPTTIIDCAIEAVECDTVYVTEYETIFDTIVNTEFIYEIIVDTLEVEVLVPEYIYVTDTVTIYEDILDTLYVDVIQEVEVVVYDTIAEVEYVEFIEYITEYIDCETGMPCNSSINELINK